jgi:mono/diheme cytochrome c family protein
MNNSNKQSGRQSKDFGRHFLSAILATLCLSSTGWVLAQDSAPKTTATAAANPGRDLVVGKCLQCHSDTIWRDQRQDARAWEATLYRMVARGAVWTGEDIKIMSNYLATDFGPNSPKVASSAR